MIPSQRHDEILEILENDDKIEMKDLSNRFGVTLMTIRRDLIYLEQKGLLERIRGGAAKIKRITSENLFVQKNQQNSKEKIAIGKKVSQFLEDNDTVFVNPGSTVLHAMTQLKGLALKIITNNPMISFLEIDPKNSVFLIGGELRRESHSIVGESAMNMLGQIYANKCILGADGVSLKYGLTNSSLTEAMLNKKMIDQTRGKIIVLADHTKIGKVGPFLTCPIEFIDILITTKGFPEEYTIQLQSKGIQVVVADE